MAIPEPTTAAGREGLAALLDAPERAVIALDFDGTLAPIVPNPEDARALPQTVPVLQRLAPLIGAVVVITGRPAELAVEYGGFAEAEGLEHLTVLGHYGAERWDAATGELTTPPPHPGVAELRRELPGLLADAGAPEGVRTEDKGASLAVHTRQAADPAAALAAVTPALEAAAARLGLAVEPGRMVLELRPPGVDKGSALRAFLTEHDATAVLYAGDDLGDVAAFDAVREGRGTRPGLLVCSAPATGEPPVAELASRADLVVHGPEGVLALLSALTDAP